MTVTHLGGQHDKQGETNDFRRRFATSIQCSLVLIVAVIAVPVQAATYYLNTSTGAATNPGTSSQPWATMDQVRSHASNGDVVVIQHADAATYAAMWPDQVSYRANIVQQFGITWQFDRDYIIGQFVTGDFWVIGPVTLTKIDPESVSADGRIKNGSMVNPSPKIGTQGYDSAMVSNTYSAALNVAYGRSPNNPLVLAAHSSLVSTISRATSGAIPQLERAAILTVLPAAAAPGSFRPPYCGTDKTVKFNKTALNYSLLKSLQPVSNTPSLASVEAKFAAPWIEHRGGWTATALFPTLNMPVYGREIHTAIGEGALMLHLNFTPAEKERLLCRYVQLGIDLYGVIFNGGLWNWVGEGGHGGGRKWPILLAGMVLNDPDMKAIGQKSGDYLYQNGYGPGNCPPDYIHFGEDDQTFYVSSLDVAITSGPSWKPDSRDTERIPYAESDIGLPEWGIAHAHVPTTSNKWLPTIYRSVACPPFHGTALAALLVDGAKELWNHDAYFDYTDRYMAFTAPGGEGAGLPRSTSAFTVRMWDAYRSQCGPIWPQTGDRNAPVLSLIGDKRITPGQTLTFTVTATDANGDPLVYSATGLPSGAVFSDRTFTWTPASGNLGSYQVTFTVSDGSAQDSETITITVERPNAAPILAGIGNKTTNENQPISFSISATDADGDPITYSATGVPSGATFTGQTFTWTPTYSQAGTYNVTFMAGDGRAQDSQTITISVVNVNRPPTLAEIGDRSVDENSTLSFTLLATDPDGAGLTYSAAGLPAGANLSGQNFTWKPTVDQVGSHEITFTVSDGTVTDSETITVAVVSTSADHAAPLVARQSPAPGAIQVALNNLITLHVTDAGRGVDAGSVRIAVDGKVVYQGDTAVYTSASGRCSRSGVRNNYQFIYQHDQMFHFDHEVTVTVNAADLAGNVMNEASYSFATEMRAFSSNKRVSKTGTAAMGRPVTVGDAAGNIWVAWHAGPENARDIYVARLPAGQEAFETPVQITTDSGDQRDPDLALGKDGSLYVVWQDNRRGHWDIFGSTSSNGETFARESLITDSDGNQIAPTAAVDGGSPSRVYVAWQDDRNGNQDIYVASSTNAFASVTTSRITADAADQTSPDVAVDAANRVYLVWTDRRAGQADIYGAASTTSWTNLALVTGPGNQTDPALAITPGGSALHLVWVDSTSGDADIYYASSNGLPTGPMTGVNIIDDTSGAAQTDPALACAADGTVFACWQDTRNVGLYGTDTDVYFAELSSGTAKTNVLVGDDGSGANQGQPAISVTTANQPYIVWTDDRNTTMEIYCAATTSIDPTPLYSAMVAAATGATIGADPTTITHTEDVSIVVPAGACPADLRITISKILNPLISPSDCLGSYDFGPSGIDFAQPVTVTIPYTVTDTNHQARAYWYNSLTGALSQQGITDIENITITATLYALRFKTVHFTPYYVVANDSAVMAFSSNDGGGCSISTSGGGSPRHLLVPYGIVAVAMAILRRRDRKRAMRTIES